MVLDSSPSEPVVNWKKVDQVHINNYQTVLQNNHHLLNISHTELISKRSIDQAYTVLVREIATAAQNCFSLKSYKRYLKPYWNQELRGLHSKMKTKRNSWVRDGKPRNMNCLSYSEYKTAKRDFRRCHRKYAAKYLQSQLDEINRVAEVDTAHFWRLVNARRKTSNTNPGSEIIFHGQSYNTAKEINKEWAQHFRNLYTPTQSDHFDANFYDMVSQEVRQIKSTLENSADSSRYPVISPEEVDSAVKLAQCNKSGGEDGIMYEHIKYGGFILHKVLSILFTAIIRLAHAPKDMKKGVIVTIFKGGNKRKDNPDNYRAITLSSVILKLLERILLTRIELFDDINPPIHPLQGGFKKQQGCLMTSYLVKEALLFAKENSSKVFACFLDVKKAFDQVWHDGLFYKLYNCGVNKTILRVIIDLYTEMQSCVKNQSHKSEWFPVQQGTRQGGVLSPFLYLVFDNDLIWELDQSGLGLSIFNINCGSPAVADDKLILSLSKLGADHMIKICYNHSGKWRYEYQPPKCTVIAFNESPLDYRVANRNWVLGNAFVGEDILYKHLGIYH